MANVNVKVDIKYSVQEKSGHKEVSQRFINQTLYFPEVTEAQLQSVIDYVDTVTDIEDLVSD